MRWSLLIISLIFFTHMLTFGQTDNEIKTKQTELDKIRKDINEWETKLKQKVKSEKSTLELIDTYDKKLNLLRKLVDQLHTKEYTLENEIKKTKSKINELEKQVDFIKTQYSKFVAIAYRRGRTFDLELLIGSESLNQFYIRSVYLKKFSEQRVRDIEKIGIKHDELDKQRTLFEKQLSEQRIVIKEKSQEQEKIISNTLSRKKALDEIRRDKNSYAQELKRRKQSAADLQNLISKLIELEKAKSQTPEYEELSAAYSRDGGHFEKRRGKLPWPVTKGRVVTRFGNQQHPVLKTITQNTGIDISVPPGTEVFSIADGIVSTIWWLPSFGNLVIINHFNGYRTVYAHLSDIQVNEGEKIKEGNNIGKSGESLNGSMVHFEVWKDRDKQDPELWLSPQRLTKR